MENKNDYYKKSIKCECGINIMRGNLYNHKKSKKHFKLIQNKKIPENLETRLKNIDDNISYLIKLILISKYELELKIDSLNKK